MDVSSDFMALYTNAVYYYMYYYYVEGVTLLIGPLRGFEV